MSDSKKNYFKFFKKIINLNKQGRYYNRQLYFRLQGVFEIIEIFIFDVNTVFKEKLIRSKKNNFIPSVIYDI